MKQSLFAAVAAFMFAGGTAVAADLPGKAPAYKAPAYAYYGWSGCYVGGQGGYGFADADWDHLVGYTSTAVRHEPTGGLAGGHVGCRFQSSQWVFGVELSGSAAWLKEETAGQVPVDPGVRRATEIRDIFLLTGHVGMAWDRTLLYVLGGAASSNVHTHSLVIGSGVTSDQSDRRTGWVVGAGLSYMLTNNWVVGVEYNYINLGSDFQSASFSNGPCTGCGFDLDVRIQTVTGRLSYKFGGPIAARY